MFGIRNLFIMIVCLQRWMSPWGRHRYHQPLTPRTNPFPHCNLTRWPLQPPPIRPPPFPQAPPHVSCYVKVTRHQRGQKSDRNTHSRLRHSQTLSAWLTPDDSWGQEFFRFFFFLKKYLYRDSFIPSDRPPKGPTNFSPPPRGVFCVLRCNAHFGLGLRWLRSCVPPT